MTDDTQRRGLVSDLTRRLALLDLDHVRALDRIALRLDQLRYVWMRRAPTGKHDADAYYHLTSTIGASEVTRCAGRWARTDAARVTASPPATERCMSCQRAAWSDSASDLDPLIVAVLEQLAADDLALANLREAARAEMVGEG